jgi:hypothetical protein
MAGLPVTVVSSGGLAVTEALNGYGMPVSVVTAYGLPVTAVASGGLPVTGLDTGSSVGPAYRMIARAGSFVLSGESMETITEISSPAPLQASAGAFALAFQDATLTPPSSPSTTWDSDASAHYSQVTLTTPLILHAGQGFGQASARTLSTVGRVLGSGGKAYFEMKTSVWSGFSIMGISQADAMFAAGGTIRSAGTFCGGFGNDGVTYINGTTIYTPIACGSSNDAWVSVAIDFTARRMWFAMDFSASGVWMNSPTANPATGVGGIDISGLSAGTYFIATTTIGGEDVTLNAGSSAFFRAMPAGFSNF